MSPEFCAWFWRSDIIAQSHCSCCSSKKTVLVIVRISYRNAEELQFYTESLSPTSAYISVAELFLCSRWVLRIVCGPHYMTRAIALR
eukprot:4253187-Amphidinium_carterae.4